MPTSDFRTPTSSQPHPAITLHSTKQPKDLPMPNLKPLNIGMIGYGFMGRTHTNAYKRVNDFFDQIGRAHV